MHAKEACSLGACIAAAAAAATGAAALLQQTSNANARHCLFVKPLPYE
jgi:hypothetical protein